MRTSLRFFPVSAVVVPVVLLPILFAGVAVAPARQADTAGGSVAEEERSATDDTGTAVDAGVALPREVAQSFVDRTPLDAAGQSLTEALRHAFSLSPDQLDAAAKRHAEQRRAVLSRSSGETIDALSTTRDLMRFPDAGRGRPVQFDGVVREVTELSLASGPVSLIRLSPSDAAESAVAVMLPVTDEPPSPGDRVGTAGLFLKVVELPAGGDTADASLALLVAAPHIERKPGSDDLLPEASLWSVVQHRKLGVLPTESGLYYRLLHQAAEADPQALRQAATAFADQRRQAANWKRLPAEQPFPTFVDLFKNPEAYEGQAVSFSGYAREIRKYPAGENAFGLESLYEAWVYTDDSQGNPAVIVSAAAPDDVPLGADLQTPVRVTGYFFKIYGYEAHDTTRIAPMILASRIEVLPEAEISGPPWWLLAILGAVFGGLIVWLAVSYYASRKRAPRMFRTDEHPDLSGLE